MSFGPYPLKTPPLPSDRANGAPLHGDFAMHRVYGRDPVIRDPDTGALAAMDRIPPGAKCPAASRDKGLSLSPGDKTRV